MRILITGATGQVGTQLALRLPLRLSTVEIIPLSRSGKFAGTACASVDFTNPKLLSTAVLQATPDLVINAAAYTNVDGAESESELASSVNGDGPGVIADACAVLGIPMIHLSTDYVFSGGATTPYQPGDRTGPLNLYGATKLQGELAVHRAQIDALVLRTSWLYGLTGKNFLKTMLGLADRTEIRVVGDQVGCPTPAWLVAESIAAMIARGFSGTQVHHIAAAGETSWAGFANAIFEEAIIAGYIRSRPDIVPLTSAEYPAVALRPNYSVLSTDSLARQFDINLPSWRESLRMTFSNDLDEQARSIQ